MRENVNIGAIKRALERNRSSARHWVQVGDEKGWATYDSPIEDFGETFFETLPNENGHKKVLLSTEEKGEVFREYTEKTLGRKGEELTAVAFGGPESKLFRGFTKKFFKITIGVCLDDIRDNKDIDKDEENNHFVILGDVMEVQNNHLLEQIKKKIKSEKTNLIISRIDAPLLLINKNPAILDRVIRNWYGMLNENGLMFIQFTFGNSFTSSTQADIEKWATAVKRKFSEIDIKVGKGMMRLHKKTGSPERLPPTTELFK